MDLSCCAITGGTQFHYYTGGTHCLLRPSVVFCVANTMHTSFLFRCLQQEVKRSNYWPTDTFMREFKVQLHNTPTWVPSHRQRERERERDCEKYTLWCSGVGPLLSGVVLGIKSAWGWERVAATQLVGLKTHFKFCRDDMSRPPLRLCWQGDS